MTNTTDWPAAIAILAAGLILGFLVIYFVRRRKSGDAANPPELETLLEKIRATDDADERARLESEAANLLREMEEAPREPSRSRPMLAGYALGVVSTVALGALGWFVYTKAQPRNGTSPMSGPVAAAAAAPTDIEGRIELAKTYFTQDNLMGVYEQTSAVLQENPNEPRALAYNAIVKLAMGQHEESKAMLERATKIDPKLLDAWVGLATVYAQTGDKNAATKAIESAIAQHPQDEKRLREVLGRILAPAPPKDPAQQTAASAPGEMPEGHPPLASRTIHVTLQAEGAAAEKGGVVYVIARASNDKNGHPVAVKRIDTNAFPVTIDLGAEDSMMGGPLPPVVNVEARLDTDGDAATKEPAAPKATAMNIAAGSGVTLTLK